MKLPDPTEHVFYPVRIYLNEDHTINRKIPIDPSTGADAERPMMSTFDEAKDIADAWDIELASPLSTHGVSFAFPAAPPPALTPAEAVEAEYLEALDQHTRVVQSPTSTEADKQRAFERFKAAEKAREGFEYQKRVDFTDKGNANLLIELAGGDLRFIAETKQWMRWTGKRWEIDEHEVFVTGFATQVARHYFDEANEFRARGRTDESEPREKWALKSRNKTAIENMITLARKSPGVPISVTELDRKPHLLGVENGVVDLRTGELREQEARDDYVTKRCAVAYRPNATAPRWEQLLTEVTGAPIPAQLNVAGEVIPGTVGRYTPRPALRHYIHKALGYAATGETHEQKFFVGIGEGSNGKGLIFDTTKAILGPYAVALPSDALMATKHSADAERPTALAAKLAGARFVVASESKEGQTLDIGLIKAHTGDEQMTARRMRENPFTFAITHKLWLLTNTQPSIDHLDAATRGRIHMMPFDRRWNRPGESSRDPELPDGDKNLMATLRAEAEGILASLVRGAVLYYREGLAPPEEVTKRTQEYVAEQDHLGRWLKTMEPCAPRDGTKSTILYTNFCLWCGQEAQGVKLPKQNAFSRSLTARKVKVEELRDGNYWGLRNPSSTPAPMTPPPPPPPPPAY